MKFIHTADWHLGKLFYGEYLTEEQEWLLKNQFLPLIDEEKPDVILLAGDVYDRSVPPAEAVELFDEMIEQIKKVFGIFYICEVLRTEKKLENIKEATVIELKNSRVFIGVYIVPLFILIGLIISKITIYSILMCLTIFIFLNIGNYIAIRNIGSIETLTLNNVSITIRRLKKNKKIGLL